MELAIWFILQFKELSGILPKELGTNQGVIMSKAKQQEHYFYGYPIIRNQQEEYIKKLLKKYKKEPVSEELKQKVWDELQMEKHFGRITIPFKLAVRKDPTGKFPDCIEIILDTKV